jgi:four helix bundle protein
MAGCEKAAGSIYSVSSSGAFARDFGLRDQIRRSAVSIMSNISEGYERSTRKEFALFLGYAKGSAGELRSQLYVALDQQYITAEQFQNLYGLVTEISSQLSKFATYLRSIKAAKLAGAVSLLLMAF